MLNGFADINIGGSYHPYIGLDYLGRSYPHEFTGFQHSQQSDLRG